MFPTVSFRQQLFSFITDTQLTYTQMSTSTGEVALDIMDQSFSGNLVEPQPATSTNSEDGAFGSMIRKRGIDIFMFSLKGTQLITTGDFWWFEIVNMKMHCV